MKIKDLDPKKIKVPAGYKVIIDPDLIEQERKENEKVELQERIASMKESTEEELVELGRIYHPYYQDLIRLESLK